MDRSCLVLLALGACASVAHAQAPDPYRIVIPGPDGDLSISVIEVSDLFEPGLADTETKVFGYPGKRMGLTNAGEPRRLTLSGLERDSRNSRAWGLSVGFQSGPVTFRVAHQNKNVIRVAPALSMGNRLDAKNTILAANVSLGLVKAYAAYSANRGWGSSPLWNPDNPYGASLATTPSTDSRDVLVGVALPYGQTTFLASFIRKNDRDLANHDADQVAFGATYKVSRRADYYAAYSLTRPRTVFGQDKNSSALNIGMRHSF
ncbi:MAG: porin [Pseudomonadota bacterium]